MAPRKPVSVNEDQMENLLQFALGDKVVPASVDWNNTEKVTVLHIKPTNVIANLSMPNNEYTLDFDVISKFIDSCPLSTAFLEDEEPTWLIFKNSGYPQLPRANPLWEPSTMATASPLLQSRSERL